METSGRLSMKTLRDDGLERPPPLLPAGQLGAAINPPVVRAGDLAYFQPRPPGPDGYQRLVAELDREFYFLPGLLPDGVVPGANISVSRAEKEVGGPGQEPVAHGPVPRHPGGPGVQEARALGEIVAVEQRLDEPVQLRGVGVAVGIQRDGDVPGG